MSLKTRGSGSLYLVLSIFFLLLLLHLRSSQSESDIEAIQPLQQLELKQGSKSKYDWTSRPVKYPVQRFLPLPKASKRKLPPIQHHFKSESTKAKEVREQRASAVKAAFVRCWTSYRRYAWLQDELTPVSGSGKSTFGGWAATLVDSLDTLWIMDLKEEFDEAVDATLSIDFTNTTSNKISLFETNIRYLGGMLSAYDLSQDERLLHKAIELAETLYAAFDTPNRMPINWWDLQAAADGGSQEAEEGVLSAEIGSLSIEFTHLAQLTGNSKWYDAVARVMEVFSDQQDLTNLPGMWPLAVNARTEDFATGITFTLGAMADSLYEYLPKMYALLSGSNMYEQMYLKAMDTAIQYSLFRPMLPDNADVLIPGALNVPKPGSVQLEPSGQHLGCFVGGMLALGGRLMDNETHVALGRKVTDGCVWAYEHSPLGMMPESFNMLPCSNQASCVWDSADWQKAVVKEAGNTKLQDGVAIAAEKHIPQGFTSIGDRRYILRPEAIESVFILYRITGDTELLEKGWMMWQSIDKHTKTELANSAIWDMSDPEAPKSDSMESFWTAETLKYFYLLFSPTTLISLDEYIFNTEAHPMKRPSSSWW